ncbi:MAG: diguanylate cyclase [Lutisporaceae bacterium]
MKKYNLEELYTTRAKVTIGIVSGTLGIILMLFSIEVNNNTIIDFRNIATIMSAIFGGAIPVFISGIMIALFRVTYFGVNNASLLGVVVAIVNSIGCWYIGKYKINSWKKWTYATIFVLIVSSIALTVLLKNRIDFFSIMAIYWISHCIVSAITYWYVSYSLTSNKVYRRLKKESTKDFLTDLNNVRQFDLVLNSAIKNVREKDENLSLLMVDIDFFKKVNDTYGHKEGDVVLIELGKILSENCRTFDEVSRNGGEEFSVLLLDCPNSQAIRIAERIRHNVEVHPFILTTSTQINITVSIGVASYPETITDLEKLVEKADTELYYAKRTGRNKVCSNQSYLVVNKSEV